MPDRFRLLPVPGDDGHYVEAAPLVLEPEFFEVIPGGLDYLPLLVAGNRGFRGNETLFPLRLDLDEDEDVPVAGDDIDLSYGATEVPGDDLELPLSQITGRRFFPPLPQS